MFLPHRDEPGTLVRLLPGSFPGKKKRKALKADFDVLVLLPRFSGFRHGALLALGPARGPDGGAACCCPSMRPRHKRRFQASTCPVFTGIGRQTG